MYGSVCLLNCVGMWVLGFRGVLRVGCFDFFGGVYIWWSVWCECVLVVLDFVCIFCVFYFCINFFDVFVFGGCGECWVVCWFFVLLDFSYVDFLFFVVLVVIFLGWVGYGI